MNKLITILFAMALTTAVWAQEESNTPGWANAEGWVDATEVDGSRESEEGFGLGTGISGGQSAIAEAITPEIQELARGLENDPKRIFDYVHDHIRHILYFGSKKGAQLTLLERSGNDFDQSALLAALLRAAGYTSVGYEFGVLKMPYDAADGSENDLHHWLGLTLLNTNWAATKDYFSYLLGTRGYPSNAFFTFSGDTTNLAFHRVWVTLTLGGTNYYLDPAFKVTEPTSGVDLKVITQVNSNGLWTAAGGTSTSDYAQNLSESATRNKLRDYTTNFLYFMQTNSNPNASVEEILGGGRIVSSAGSKLPRVRPFATYSGLATVAWTYQPTNLMASMKITTQDWPAPFWFLPELQGQRLHFQCDTNAQVWLRLGDTVVFVISATTNRWSTNFGFSVNHPHGAWNTNLNSFVDGTANDTPEVHISLYEYAAAYDIEYGFEASPQRLHRAQEQLDRYRQQGFADSSDEVVSQTLHVMSLAWMLQTELLSRTVGAQLNIMPMHHHRLLTMGQIQNGGYYLDAWGDLYAASPNSGHSGADMQRLYKGWDISQYFASAFEHGVIEELQSGGVVAGSTIKVLQLANANDVKVYRLAADNWNSVSNSLAGGGWRVPAFTSRVFSNGLTVLLARDVTVQLAGSGSHSCEAFVANGFVGNGLRFNEMQIGVNGGGITAYDNAVLDPSFIASYNSARSDVFNLTPASQRAPTGGDPVSMSDGAFRLNAMDLSLGSVEPRGINFVRHYSPTRRYVNPAGMSYGWTHNYNCSLKEVSAFEAGLGLTTAAQMAPMIAATAAAIELYGTNAVPKNWLTTALIAKWAVDQLITNGVSVTLGNDTLQFVRQPNGEYTPPANCTMTLVPSGAFYLLLERNGRIFLFDESSRLSIIQDQFFQNATIDYLSSTSSLPKTVTDWKNRSLQFNYSNGVLTNVADSTGRNVFYGYTDNGHGQLDLTSVTEVENKASRMVYDTNHQVVAVSNAIPQLVVSNAFNNFGQVVTQYTAGDINKRWQFFWSGYANTEQDPTGARRRFYLDDKHRFVGLQDALGNLWQTFYDGQDHPITTVSPLSETNRFLFDGRHNLTLTLDGLSFSNIFLIDADDNVVGWVDESGNTNRFGYNSGFQVTGVTNGAGEWMSFGYKLADGVVLDGLLTNITTASGSIGLGHDLGGYVNRITYPAGLGSEGFLNNALGDILSWTNGRSSVFSFQYNQRRQLTNAIGPTNLTFSVLLDAVGNAQAFTDGRGFITTNLWSATRKLLATAFPATPQGVPVIGNAYDNRDWLARTTNALGKVTQFGLDAAGRWISITDPLNRANRFGFDADGRNTSVTNAALEVASQQLNARGEATNLIDAASHSVGLALDAVGNTTALTNRNSKRWQFGFDKANRQTNIISPLLHANSVTFDQSGLPNIVRQPSGKNATNSFDAKRRLTNITDQVGIRLLKWDANDNLTNIVEGANSNSWTWDAYDLMSSSKDPDGNLIQFRMDANGGVTNLIYPGNRVVTYKLNAFGLPTNIVDWLGGQSFIEYDLALRPVRITRPNGSIRIINRNGAGEITNIVEQLANNAPIAFFKQHWNDAGRIDWEFAAHARRGVSPAGLTNTTFCDADNRLTNFNGVIVTNDLDGNMTWGPLTNNTFATYTFNARNWLVGTAVPSGPQVTYGYDALGSRTSLTNGTNVTRFVVDPNTSQTLMRIKNGVTNYYIYGLGLLYEITETATSTSTSTYHSDYRGSTIAITDGNGNVTDRAEYSAYGLFTYRSGSTDTPFWFNGRYGVQTDPNGLLYMRARYYNPYICRFINADPAGFLGGLNLYAYADGNPISLMDPFGLGASGEGPAHTWLASQASGYYGDAQGALDTAAAIAHGFVNLARENDFIGSHLFGTYSWADRQISAAAGAFQNGLDSGARSIGVRNDNAAFVAHAFWSEMGTGIGAMMIGGRGLRGIGPARTFVGPARNVVRFQGMEVRAVRDLSHLTDGRLEAMQEFGIAGATRSGERIVLHHLNQNHAGPVVEMPEANHNTWNRVQHPFGNVPGVGLSPQQRTAFDMWREDYWSWRATQEMYRRRLLP